VLIANGGLIISEFVGTGAAAELLGVSKFVAVPFAAALIWLLVVLTNYGRVEKVFLTVSLVFLTYPVAAILAHPHWNEVARGLFIPRVHLSADYLMLLVGLMGSALTPYQQLFQQSSTVEKGVARRHYGLERVDTYAGSVFNTLMAAFIVIATATTLHAVGKTNIGSAAEAAQALGPVAGKAAAGVFAVGLLGASMLAGAVLPLATAYSVAEAFGFPKGVNLDFRRARTFFRLFTLLIVLGAGVALVPKLPVIQLLVWIQVLNGMLLPIVLVFSLLLINDRRLCADLKNTPLLNVLGWGTFAMVTTAVLVLLGSQVLHLFGVNLLGPGS
jgi:Mn2+/Fe2+ NRAMP family transporter